MTITERKEREKEQKKMQIISAAEKLFFQSGYDQVSMDEIAREAELSKGTIFFYFKNKEALFITIVLRGIRLFHQMVNDACMAHGNLPFDQLTAMGMAVIRFSRKYPGYLSAMRLFKSGRFSLENDADQNEEIAEIIRHSLELTVNMEFIVKEGMRNGTIRNDIDPMEMTVIIRMLIGCVMDISPEIKWTLKSHCIPEEQIIRRFCTLMGSMITGKQK